MASGMPAPMCGERTRRPKTVGAPQRTWTPSTLRMVVEQAAGHLCLRAHTPLHHRHARHIIHTHTHTPLGFATAHANAMSDHSRRWEKKTEGEKSLSY